MGAIESIAPVLNLGKDIKVTPLESAEIKGILIHAASTIAE